MKATALIVPPLEVEERFWSKVNMEGECWLWTGTQRSKDGLGVFGFDGKIVYAHRLAYVISRGILPPKFEVRRMCSSTLCVRPLHLVLVPRDARAKFDILQAPSQSWLM